ncbi:MAG: multiheme c-type cytochrome [Planctomycetota bacterium]|jgi:predicted CXXCH cytochrome family protein
MAIQIGVFAAGVVAAAVLLAGGGLPKRAMIAIGASVPVLALLVFATWTLGTGRHMRSAAMLADAVPDFAMQEEGYVSSNRCASCHPSEYHSWHDSFHRTMTQAVTPETVLADMDGVHLEARGRTATFERRGDEYWVEVIDPAWEHEQLAQGLMPNTLPDPPRVQRRIVMSTGSHHQQTYWVGDEEDGKLYNVPFVWLNEDQRWVPRADVFLRTEAYGPTFATWHDNCIECHATAGEKEHDPASNRFDPKVAELGIACEACHGPAEEHIRANQDPRRRYRLRMTGEPDPTIVNPARLDPVKSSQVCGQCHAINVFKRTAHREGERYRPGGELNETRMVLRNSDRNMTEREKQDWPLLQAHIERQTPTFIEDCLWPDGEVRVGGREYLAMTESACYQDGTLSCLACHSMHEGDPASQLKPDLQGDAACLSCHAEIGDDIAAHTHHPLGTAGSACNNCHMPHTAWGLLKSIRSHRIDSPRVATTVATGRPDACSLCHLDKTLRWTADHLTEWYGQDPVELTDEQERVAGGVLWALSGHANQRVLVAWHMGWDPAREASGTKWMTPYLGHLLADPYSAVRYVAERALRRDPQFAEMSYDFVGPPAARSQARQATIGAWMRLAPGKLDRSGTELLISPSGTIDAETLTSLSRKRDDRLFDLRE